MGFQNIIKLLKSDEQNLSYRGLKLNPLGYIYICCITNICAFVSLAAPSAPSKTLTAQLTCFRSAKAHLKKGLSELTHLYSLEDLFKRAMGHADEQVDNPLYIRAALRLCSRIVLYNHMYGHFMYVWWLVTN